MIDLKLTFKEIEILVDAIGWADQEGAYFPDGSSDHLIAMDLTRKLLEKLNEQDGPQLL